MKTKPRPKTKRPKIMKIVSGDYPVKADIIWNLFIQPLVASKLNPSYEWPPKHCTGGLEAKVIFLFLQINEISKS